MVVIPILAFLCGSTMIWWGWEDAHYGSRPVWMGFAVTCLGFCINVVAVVIFTSCK